MASSVGSIHKRQSPALPWIMKQRGTIWHNAWDPGVDLVTCLVFPLIVCVYSVKSCQVLRTVTVQGFAWTKLLHLSSHSIVRVDTLIIDHHWSQEIVMSQPQVNKDGEVTLMERGLVNALLEVRQGPLSRLDDIQLADDLGWWVLYSHVAMNQYLLIPFLVRWTSIYQLFLCSPGVQGFDPLPCDYSLYMSI